MKFVDLVVSQKLEEEDKESRRRGFPETRQDQPEHAREAKDGRNI